MKKLTIYRFLILATFLTNCTLFKKEIFKPVVVKIIMSDNFTAIKLNANYVKYANAFSETTYESKFLESFYAEGKITHNITIDNDAVNPDYIVEIKKLEITESDFTESINDPKSENNGKQFLLNKVEAFIHTECINAKTNKKIGMSCTSFHGKQEKLKNNRNLGDLISGSNKDHSTYRQKTLNDDIAKELVESVGRRVWVPITKRIKKSLK